MFPSSTTVLNGGPVGASKPPQDYSVYRNPQAQSFSAAGLASLFPNQDIPPVTVRPGLDCESYGMPPTSTVNMTGGSKYGVPPSSLSSTGLKFGGGSSALKGLVDGAPPVSHVLSDNEFPILSNRGVPFATTSYHHSPPTNLTTHTTIIQPNTSSGRAGYEYSAYGLMKGENLRMLDILMGVNELDRVQQSGAMLGLITNNSLPPLISQTSSFPISHANLMKQSPLNESSQSEFRIQNEDFPALPGAPLADGIITSAVSIAGPAGDASAVKESARFVSERPLPQTANTTKKGIQTHPDGTVSGIPSGMLWDQFGMAGLLTFLRAIETDPGIVALALGHDLTTLGLNLSAPEKNLWQNFGGPWSESACRMQDMDYPVPDEYLVQASIRDKLPPIKLNRYPDDLLFYLFYNYPQDMFQMAAAAELYSRDWRYHKEERVWLTRAPGHPPVEQTGLYERGTYFVFEPTHWRKVPKEMILEYSKLEERPQLPPQLQHHLPSAPS